MHESKQFQGELQLTDCQVLSAGLLSKHAALVKLSLQAIQNFLWCGDFGEDPNFDLSTWDSEHDEDFWENAEWLSKSHVSKNCLSLYNMSCRDSFGWQN